MNKKKIFLICLALLVFGGLSVYIGVNYYLNQLRTDVSFFEKDIKAFEKLDHKQFPSTNSIVFVGSSSIRLWENLEQSMAPLNVIQRGFGGAHMSHVLHNFERIITSYQPKAVVLFVGGNDIGSGKSAERLISDYQTFISKMKTQLPETDLWILSMKPSKLRWKRWPEMLKADLALKQFADNNNKIFWVPTGSSLLNIEGKPDDVYIYDGLHLNDEGYNRWTAILKPLLVDKYSDSTKL